MIVKTKDKGTISIVAHDYELISTVVQKYADGSDVEKYAREKYQKALEILLREAQKEQGSDSGLYIGQRQGSVKGKKTVKLIERFGDVDVDNEDDDMEEETGSEETERNDDIEKPIERTGLRIGGVVGALSGTVSVSNGDSEEKLHINLRIKSRMDSDKHFYFIYTLLTMGRYETHDEDVFCSEDDMFDYLLVNLLADRIREAITKGYYRTYHRFHNNDERLKGTIDIARHLKENLGKDNGRVAYSYREKTVNNSFNALLLNAYRYIKDKYPDLVEKVIDKDIMIHDYLRYLMYQVDLSGKNIGSLLHENERPIAHPYFIEYEGVRRVCIQILRNAGVSVFEEDDDQVRGFLYYLPDLWEDFLERELLNKAVLNHPRENEEISCSSQMRIQSFGTKHNDKNWHYIQSVRPDFVIKKKEKAFMILDAKFKPKWEKFVFSNNKISMGMANVLADFDKCLRDMVSVNGRAAGVIFPAENEGELDEKNWKHSVSEWNKDVFFYTVPVCVPKVKDDEEYSTWKERFGDYLKNSGEIIKTIVAEESSKQR